MAKGVIRPEWWVTCGGCGAERCTCESNRRKASQMLRLEFGWRNTHKRGWLCPACYSLAAPAAVPEGAQMSATQPAANH